MNEDSTAVAMDPGIVIDVRVPFHVPPGTLPVAVAVHDVSSSGGATVKLP